MMQTLHSVILLSFFSVLKFSKIVCPPNMVTWGEGVSRISDKWWHERSGLGNRQISGEVLFKWPQKLIIFEIRCNLLDWETIRAVSCSGYYCFSVEEGGGGGMLISFCVIILIINTIIYLFIYSFFWVDKFTCNKTVGNKKYLRLTWRANWRQLPTVKVY